MQDPLWRTCGELQVTQSLAVGPAQVKQEVSHSKQSAI